MNKLRPCQNKNCVNHDQSVESGCSDELGKIRFSWVEDCPQYQPEPQESAWEMFRRLNRKYKHRFIESLSKWMFSGTSDLHKISGYFLWTSSESSAIRIMAEIEKDLEK